MSTAGGLRLLMEASDKLRGMRLSEYHKWRQAFERRVFARVCWYAHLWDVKDQSQRLLTWNGK